MKYERFEQLPVWLAAIDLAVQVCKLSSAREFLRLRSLRDQLECATISISNNIAEAARQ